MFTKLREINSVVLIVNPALSAKVKTVTKMMGPPNPAVAVASAANAADPVATANTFHAEEDIFMIVAFISDSDEMKISL